MFPKSIFSTVINDVTVTELPSIINQIRHGNLHNSLKNKTLDNSSEIQSLLRTRFLFNGYSESDNDVFTYSFSFKEKTIHRNLSLFPDFYFYQKKKINRNQNNFQVVLEEADSHKVSILKLNQQQTISSDFKKHIFIPIKGAFKINDVFCSENQLVSVKQRIKAISSLNSTSEVLALQF